jgi:hypothetical protein
LNYLGSNPIGRLGCALFATQQLTLSEINPPWPPFFKGGKRHAKEEMTVFTSMTARTIPPYEKEKTTSIFEKDKKTPL